MFEAFGDEYLDRRYFIPLLFTVTFWNQHSRQESASEIVTLPAALIVALERALLLAIFHVTPWSVPVVLTCAPSTVVFRVTAVPSSPDCFVGKTVNISILSRNRIA